MRDADDVRIGDRQAGAAHDGGTALEAIDGALARFAGSIAHAGRVALQHGERQYTYGDLATAIDQAIRVLRDHRIGPRRHIALLMENCPEYVVWYLAALKAGNPLTPLHPKSSSADLAFILADADVELLIYSSEMAHLAIEIAALSSLVARVHAALCWQETAQITPSDVAIGAEVAITPGDIAKITYTGGTTGRPKGVVQTHEMLRQCVLMELAEWPWPRPSRFMATTPLSHGAGFFIIPTLMLGGTVITTSRTGAVDLAAEISTAGATLTFVVPSLIHAFLTALPDPGGQLASLEMIVYGGSPIAVADLNRSIELFPGKLVQLYGQTESPMILATLRPEDHDLSDPARVRSCGVPSTGVTVTIRGKDNSEMPAGAVGEICARGPLVMPQYWQRPEETANALRGGWLRTGDLGIKGKDGYITVVGRKKDMIITGGFNVYPKEVEDALLAHPDVLEAAVFGVPDATWGEKLVAVVVADQQRALDIEALAGHIRELKGPVQTPKQILVVDRIPLTAVGKPDKVSLRAEFGSHGRTGLASDGGA
jgi:fatty-acyl-CoA synthase